MTERELEKKEDLGLLLFCIGAGLVINGLGVYLWARTENQLHRENLAGKIRSALVATWQQTKFDERLTAIEGKIGIADAIGTKTVEPTGKV